MTADNLDIYNFRRLSPTMTTSGQPTEQQFASLRDAGIRTVINLALADSPRALPDEAATLAALDIRYIHIPVDFAAPAERDFEAFVAAVSGAGTAPLHVHCVANYRVSAFVYRYRIEHLGWSVEDAEPDIRAVWTPDALWRRFLQQP